MAMQDTTPIPKILSVLLLIGMVLLIVAFVFLTICALVMVIPSDIQAKLFSSVSESKPMPNPLSMGMVFGGGAIVAGAWFFVLKTLRKVVSTVIAGDPFVPDNISRLRRIWLIIAAAEIFRMIVNYIASLQGIGDADVDIRIGTWFMVFVIATLAEAFRYGAELRRDQELTI